jgi:hypothetical protein
MKKNIKILICLMVFGSGQLGFGQISIYYCEQTGKVGYSVSATNDNFERDKNAENDCYNNGGKNPLQKSSSNGYGCYAIVKGTTLNGGWAMASASGGGRTVEQCIQDAKWRITSIYNAVNSSVSVYRQGCIEAPKQVNNSQNTNQPTKEVPWSNWKKINSPKCDVGIEYCTKREEHYKLNYQLWFYYKVRNTSNKNISFDFNLTQKGKKEFSQGHNIGAGGTDEFMHKMSGDYIDGVSVSKVLNTETNKDICDDNQSNSADNKSFLALIDDYNKLCTELNNSRDPLFTNAARTHCTLGMNMENNSQNTNLLKSKIKTIEGIMSKNGNSSNLENSLDELIAKRNSLCDELKSKGQNSYTEIYNSYCGQEQLSGSFQNQISQMKSKIQTIEQLMNGAENKNREKEKAAEEEAARKQKAEDDKREQYNTAIQNGDSAMDSKQFSSAMSYYSNAKSYAQTSSETAEADRKYKEAFEAKKTAERTERVAKVQADDLVKDAQYAGLTASFVGLAAFLKDSYSPKWYAMKFQLGLGLESFPLISNNVNQYHWDQTYIESFTVPSFHIGLKSGFFNNKGISAEINPQFNLGFSALSPGKSGGYVELYFGNKGYSIFKVFVEGGYFKRSGTFKYDYDAANAKSDGTLTTNSDDVREGIFSHGKIKYGAGIQLRWINDEGKETFIRPAVYYEKASFFEPDTKPVLNMNLQVNILSEIIIELTYVKNYFIPGEVKYPSTLTKENMNFWGIKLIRQGKLF